jgi:membrane-associated phospholipid phosphatase
MKIQRLDSIIWIVIAIAVGAVIASSIFSSFVIAWPSFAKGALVCALLVLISRFYRHIRKDQALAEALSGASQIVAFASVAAPLSYIGASAAYPLWDMELTAWDRSLAFDWLTWLAFMNAWPALHMITKIAYGSFAVQTTMIVMALGMAGRSVHMRLFILALFSTTLVTIAISALMPAQGVWGAWHLSLSDAPAIIPTTRDLPLPVFFGLRDGSYRLLVGDNAEGVISFPSLHAALGLLFIFALWPMRGLRWVGLVVNAVMIAATPIEGSHYFTDVLAGVAIAALCWSAVRRQIMTGGQAEERTVIGGETESIPHLAASAPRLQTSGL